MGSVGKEVVLILVLLVSTMQPLMAIRPLDDHRAAAVEMAMPEELSRLVLELLPRGPVHQGPSTCTNVPGRNGASCPNH
ncbi:hypothetical protein QJS04_geneDACA013119 [Acorus gramineus]|uniref:Uncharacterized protein n=1 Tax=Acorus gramineus TaxID=55184 RepID=A0AAV9B491_ACOGR|nr:hypothetical protein QJS04_geneDACA024023 [Acorus gramineus]KAK1271425.1 hypothetical protein QJS04_geneDACA013119 [Acorus gramineus]